MKKYVSIALLFAGPFCSWGQSASYTVLENSAQKALARFAFTPVHMDIQLRDELQMISGYGINFSASPIPMVNVNFGYYGSAYLDIASWDHKSSIDPAFNYDETNYRKSRVLDLEVEFIPIGGVGNGTYTVGLSSKTTGYNQSQVTYINVPAKKRGYFGLHAGLTSYRRNRDGIDLVSTDGYQFQDNRLVGPAGEGQSVQGSSWYYTQSTTAFYAGLIVGSVGYLKADVKGYGTRHAGGMSKFFVDVMLRGSTNQTLPFEGTNYSLMEQDLEGADIFKRNGGGWRAGMVYETGRKLALGLRLEFGNRPDLGTYTKFDFNFPVANLFPQTVNKWMGKSGE